MSETVIPLRVLIVDDDLGVLHALRRTLQSTWDVNIAGDPAKALAFIQEGNVFDLVLSDYNLPVMTGVTFLTAARAKLPNAMLVLMSGGADQSTAQALVEEQGQAPVIEAFMPKPWTPEHLDSILATARAKAEGRSV